MVDATFGLFGQPSDVSLSANFCDTKGAYAPYWYHRKGDLPE